MEARAALETCAMRTLHILLLLLLSVVALADSSERAAPPSGKVVELEVTGAIGPATSDYVLRSLDKAAARGAVLVVIRLDTPGGLDTAMRDIIKRVLASSVPIATYVAPSGARAASAGTYILYASHIAAMAPATNLGAATPVSITSPMTPGSEPEPEPEKPGDKEQAKPKAPAGADAMAHKMVNDAVAYIRGLAKMRGRNPEWAEQAVREAASLPADEALRLNVIDLVAVDLPDLLHQLDGREVEVLGQSRTLRTTGLTIESIEPDWRNDLLAVITNPNVAYILLLVGFYGLIFEFSSPGAVVPGVVGAICLLLALFSFQVLPVNYAGLALILLGIALMVVEAFVPSFGVLGVGGVVAFAIGSVILMDTEAPGFGIDLSLVAAFSLSSALLFILALGMVFKARRKPVVSGQEEMLDGLGVALEDFDAYGRIRIHSEIWSARTTVPLHKGDSVRVRAMHGLVLDVAPEGPKENER